MAFLRAPLSTSKLATSANPCCGSVGPLSPNVLCHSTPNLRRRFSADSESGSDITLVSATPLQKMHLSGRLHPTPGLFLGAVINVNPSPLKAMVLRSLARWPCSVIIHLGFQLEAELRSISAQRPDPPNPSLNLETVLRSLTAQRPDLFFRLLTLGAESFATAARVFR